MAPSLLPVSLPPQYFPRKDLPPSFLVRYGVAFDALGCGLVPAQTLAHVASTIGSAFHVQESLALGPVVLCIVAAQHTVCRILPPTAPFDPNPPLWPTAAEWLLLAMRQCANVGFSPRVQAAILHIAECISVQAGTGAHVRDSLPDYGLEALFSAFVEPPNRHSSYLATLGAHLGKLARLLHEVLVLTNPKSELSEPYILHAMAEEPELRSRLSLALALSCKPIPDKLPLVAFLGHPRLHAQVTSACATFRRDLEGGDVTLWTQVEPFIDALCQGVLRKLQGVRLFGFAPPPSLDAELDRTIHLAVDAFSADPEMREAWEIQRWGGIFSEPAIGAFFPTALGLLALDATGVDITRRADALLEQRSVDGYRYFGGFADIPPDADDLGAALQLLARSASTKNDFTALAWPVEVLARNMTSEGEIPVWFTRELREPLRAQIPLWRGSRCLAVAANATIGLLEARLQLPDHLIDRSITWITRTWMTEGMNAVFFYGLRYTQFILVKLHDVACQFDLPGDARPALRTIADGITKQLQASQQGDGGYGGILDTACALAALAHAPTIDFDPWPMIAYLASRQRHDGLWPSEPLYPTPGKDNAAAAHGSKMITAALCLYALGKARSRSQNVQVR